MTTFSNVKQCLSTIKGIEAQLSTLALQSQDHNAQNAFHESMLIVGEVKNDLQNRSREMKLEEPQYKNS